MFEVVIKETSKDLSVKERVAIKQIDSFTGLGDLDPETAPLIDVDYFAVLAVHNDEAETKDYDLYIVADKDGTIYKTSSTAFWSNFKSMMDELYGTDEEYKIKVLFKESKNYKGKSYVTCTLV